MRNRTAWILTEADNRLLKELNLLYGYTIREIVEMVFSEAYPDPIRAEGEEFVFERPHLIGSDYFASANVPAPDANVSLPYAQQVAQHDVVIASYLLDNRPPTATLIAILRNHIAWDRFFAMRSPDPDRRKRFAKIADDREAALNRLLERHALKGRTSLRVVPGGKQWN